MIQDNFIFIVNYFTDPSLRITVVVHVILQYTDFFSFILWCPPEVGNGVGSAEELYEDNGYDYYTNQAISQ